MTSVSRAEERQSMDRTSSPSTYSRSESNSVPWPRTMLRCWPSSWRSWASFSGRCRRLRNGGSTRTDHGAGRLACRAASPSGPKERTVTRPAGPVPAALGPQRGRGADLAAGRDQHRARPGSAPALGGQASRTTARSSPAAGVGDGQRHRARLAEQDPGVAGPADLELRGRPAASTQSATMAAAISASTMTRAGQSRNASADQRADQRRDRGPPGQRHRRGYRGTGTEASTPSSTPSAVTPSSSASGRSCSRCRKVGRASALTSSGVT